MRIVFIHSGLEFDGQALRERPLGGTETALIGVSRELAKIAGTEVCVFTKTPRAGMFDGVAYFPLAQLAAWGATHPIDVLISIRQWMPFWLKLNARLRIYFSPDAHDQPFLHRAMEMPVTLDGKPHAIPVFSPANFLPAVDLIFCVGQWQADTFVEKLGFPREKIVVTGNAIFPENFAPLPRAQRKPGLVYSATPFRGLAELAAYFPEIRQRDPAARLVVCSGLGVYSMAQSEEERMFGELYRRLAALGAEMHGSIRQQQLARIMAENLVYAYPNTFEETFCISVLEAQAAGLPVVTSRRAALAERITHDVDGFLIEGEPSSASYKATFLEIVHRLLVDAELWQRISDRAIQTARRQTYDRLAASWHERFTAELATRAAKAAPSPAAPALVEIPSPRDPAKKMRLDSATVAHLVKVGLARYGG
jgi:glycosyltransferase involved in cell wall biosynthesis